MENIALVLTSILQAKGLKVFMSTILGAMAWAIGGYNVAILALLILMSIDFFLGLGYAFLGEHGKPSKAKFQFGLQKRVFSLVAIMVGNLFDLMIFGTSVNFGFKWAFTMYIGSDEVLSILGHLQKIGVPIPIKSVERIKDYRDSIDGKITVK